MKALTLICTPANRVNLVLELLLRQNGIAYRVECWSFRWYHCPECGVMLPGSGDVSGFLAKCAECGLYSHCEKRPEGLYVATGPTFDPTAKRT